MRAHLLQIWQDSSEAGTLWPRVWDALCTYRSILEQDLMDQQRVFANQDGAGRLLGPGPEPLQNDVNASHAQVFFDPSAYGQGWRTRLAWTCARELNAPCALSMDATLVLELWHTASLYHDDIMDQGVYRRNRSCLHRRIGVVPAVLMGDAWVGLGLKILSGMGRLDVVQMYAQVLQDLIRGQMGDLGLRATASMAQYETIMGDKTASLFRAASHMPAMLAGCGDEDQKTWAMVGHHFGMAYQWCDDADDYAQDPATWRGDHDMVQGKITYPVLCLLQTPQGLKLWHRMVQLRQEIQEVWQSVPSASTQNRKDLPCWTQNPMLTWQGGRWAAVLHEIHGQMQPFVRKTLDRGLDACEHVRCILANLRSKGLAGGKGVFCLLQDLERKLMGVGSAGASLAFTKDPDHNVIKHPKDAAS